MTPSDPLSLVGEVLDGTYRIDSLVGEGGFGVVYRAFHLGFEEPVAVKCLKIPGSLSPQTREAFLRKFREEGKLLFQLSRGTLGIVRSIALGDTTTRTGIWTPYFVLEWLEGESLAAALKIRRAQGFRGRSIDDVMRTLDRPARALAYAHEKRVAHRDVKPANLFVVRNDRDPTPTIKVLDFGIAKAMEDGPTDMRNAMTKTGFTSFTPQYAAPEQFDPTIGPTGPWTDVYSFALVIVELLIDRLPVEGNDAISLMRSTLNPAIRPTPRVKGAQVSEAVERVFARAFSIEPALRFADVGGLWDALKVATADDRARSQPLAMAPSPPSAMTQASVSQPAMTQSAMSYGSLPAVSYQPMQGTGQPAMLPTPLSISAVPAPLLPTPVDLAVVPTTGTSSAPILDSAPSVPVKRRVWAWLMFGIVLGIAMIFAFGLLTCTTCVCAAL